MSNQNFSKPQAVRCKHDNTIAFARDADAFSLSVVVSLVCPKSPVNQTHTQLRESTFHHSRDALGLSVGQSLPKVIVTLISPFMPYDNEEFTRTCGNNGDGMLGVTQPAWLV